MKILFVSASAYLSEPLGILLLMAICKREGYDVNWIILNRDNLLQTLKDYDPDVIAYSTMTSDINIIKTYDDQIKQFFAKNGKKVLRIMGGPHPTYNPDVIDEFELDAICQGDGDRAIVAVVKGDSLAGIPNIALDSKGAETKELVDDLDSLPFPDRELAYPKGSYSRECGLRSVVTSRGCPYRCSYCFNHAFNSMFKGVGKLIRRRSVDNVINELEELILHTQPVRMIRFADDTFSFRPNDWLKEFAKKYKEKIDIPFYCLMRSNTLDEKTVQLLHSAGCVSLSMAIESGLESVRNGVLKRDITQEMMKKSFDIARSYNIKCLANTLIGLPSGSIDDDLKALVIARELKPGAPTFGVTVPYQGTDIWKQGVAEGTLDPTLDVTNCYGDLSVFNHFSQEEKRIQLRIVYLGTMYCLVPSFLAPVIYKMIVRNTNLTFASLVGRIFTTLTISINIFPYIIPRSPKYLWRLLIDTVRVYKT